MSSWRVAAWTHPQDPGGFRQRTHSVEFVRFSCNDPEEPRGRCTLTVPADYPWQELINAQDPTSPVDTSLIRLYPEGVGGDGIPDAEYKLTRFSKRISDDNQAVVDLFGIDWRIASLDPAALRWYDWFAGATRTQDPDWSFGLGNDLLNGNGAFEVDTLPNAGFEDGNAGHWSTPEGGSITAIEDATQAQSGTFYGLWNPGGQGTVLRRTIPSVTIGTQFTVTGYLDDLAGTGERIRIGISGATDATHTNAYKEDGIWWAELANATQGNGSTDGTWQQTTLTFVAGEAPVELIIEYQGINDHNIAVDSFAITTGAEFDVGSWITGGSPATMNIAEISTEQAHSGTRSLKLQGSQTVYTDVFGRQSYIHVRAQYEEEVAVIPGKTYTSEAWVYHTGASDEKFMMWASRTSPQGPLAQTVDGGYLPAPGSYWMASNTQTVSPNTWTRLRWTAIADTSGLRLGFAWFGGTTDVGEQQSPTFYLDDYVLVEGLPAANIGDISDRILDDAQTDHPSVAKMPYLTGRNYDSVNDSAGNPWPREESIVLRRGMKYGSHIYGGTLRDLGYDHDVTPNTTDPTLPEWDLHIWAEGSRGATLNKAFYVGMGASGGLVAGTLPKATRILAEGADGLIAEVADTTQEAETGIYEEWLADADMTDRPSLLARAQTRLTDEAANALAVNIELDDSAPTPWADFDVGDRAQFGWAGTTTKHERTISEIALRAEADANGQIHWTPTITASRLLQGEAANKEALYRLLNAYKPLPEKGAGGGRASVGGPFGTPTVVVAASDASDISKAAAHFTCTGTNDDETINAALNLFNQGLDGYGGRLLLTEGTFNIRQSFIFPKDRVAIQGMGHSTVLKNAENTTFVLLTLNHECQVADLSIEGTGAAGAIGIETFGTESIISRVRFYNLSTAVNKLAPGTVVADCAAETVTTFVASTQGGADITIVGNTAPQAEFDLGTTSSIQGGTITGNVMGSMRGGNLAQTVIADNLIEGEMDLTFGITAENINITGNHLNGGGIKVTGKTHVTITGNTIRRPTEHGIILTDCNECLVQGNMITGASWSAADTYDGIHVAGDSNRNDIWQNRIAPDSGSQARWAINIAEATCDDNSYLGNRSGPSTDYGRNAGATTTPYNDAGTGTITTWPAAAAPQGDNLL